MSSGLSGCMAVTLGLYGRNIAQVVLGRLHELEEGDPLWLVRARAARIQLGDLRRDALLLSGTDPASSPTSEIALIFIAMLRVAMPRA
jgi:hypothetical protein